MSLIRYVTRIHFAERAVEDALPEELRAHRVLAPLIVTDADTGEALPRVLDCLPPACRPRLMALAGVEVLSLGADELASIEAGAPPAHDAVISLGGARAQEVSRLVAQGTAAPGVANAGKDRATTRISVPTLPDCLGLAQSSRMPGDSSLPEWQGPAAVICDPTLMLLAPRARLAVAGFDSLVHCLEALLSIAWNPPADGMAFDGLRRAGDWLERFVADPADPVPRREVLATALNGALASQKGLGAIHGLSNALESLTGERVHGTLHAALVAPVLRFNAPAVPDRMAMVAEALRQPPGADLGALLQEMGGRMGLVRRLGHLGLTPSGIDRAADLAAEERATGTNPRHVTVTDYRQLIESAL